MTGVVGGDMLRPDRRGMGTVDIAAVMKRRCAQIGPRLRGLRPIEHRVGIRPARVAIRLEPERTADGVDMVYNYGLGGAGVTVAWGCAEGVTALVRALD